jgi:Ca2+-binding EF-hand superfamily protein
VVRSPAPLQEEHLYKAFQVLDKDGSGYIDRDELVAALDKYGDLSDLDTILKQVGVPQWDQRPVFCCAM